MADAHDFQLVGGHVALDFANTLDNRFDAARTKELLPAYEDFVRFAQQTGVVNATQASRLHALAAREKQKALRTIHTVRELIERLFSGVVGGEKLDLHDLSPFNDYVQKALWHRILAEERGSVRWVWTDLGAAALSPLWPITVAAAELLTSGDLVRVRECSAETCRWLFLDVSKNHTRRWCDMKICGNRTKARRYYQAHS